MDAFVTAKKYRISLKPDELFEGAIVKHVDHDAYLGVIKSIDGESLIVNDVFCWCDNPANLRDVFAYRLEPYVLGRLGFELLNPNDSSPDQYRLRVDNHTINLIKESKHLEFPELFTMRVGKYTWPVSSCTDLQLAVSRLIGVDLRITPEPDSEEQEDLEREGEDY